jgi:enamine deaminase RidA (YjgF/YER057c/UK114 family)
VTTWTPVRDLIGRRGRRYLTSKRSCRKRALRSTTWCAHGCFVADIDQWEAVGRAHGDVFGDIRPATSMVEVSRLIDSDMLVEIEAVAIVGDDR